MASSAARAFPRLTARLQRADVPAAVRERLGERELRALADAVEAPVPLWLCVHLWRNGIAAACFSYDMRDGDFMQALTRHAELMLELFAASPRPDASVVTNVLYYLARLNSSPRLSDAEAAGALPPVFQVCVGIEDGGAPLFSPGQFVPCNDPDDPLRTQALALSERAFLEPAGALVPFAVRARLREPGRAEGQVLLHLGKTMHLRDPCAACHATVVSILYQPTSPTWRGLRRPEAQHRTLWPARVGAAAARSGPPVPCLCSECDHCGTRARGMKLCSRCRWHTYCGAECQLAAWPAHKAECRALVEERRAAAMGHA